jgi:SM-20-related protein
MNMPTLRLNPGHNVAALAARFAATGRLQVGGLLADTAAGWLHDHLRGRTDWRQVLNSGDKVFELDREARAAMTPAQHAALDDAVHAGARAGFQYRYETIRVPDDAGERAVSDDPLARFAAWMSGGEMRDFLRRVTGAPGIDFADAQATAYAPGDFLTAHDDAVAGKHRHAAYVFGLSPDWRAEWGGLLLFHGADSRVEGLVPSFNTLNLFAVPQVHSVSQVTRAAPMRRYSITGWLRTKPAG